MQPNYVARRSAWGAVTFLRVLFFWLIIPLIVMIVDIIRRKVEKVEFYDDYVISHKGILNTVESRSAFPGIIGVRVSQSLGGKIFGYGDVQVDVVSKWDIDLSDICKPKELKKFLETKLIDAKNVRPTFMD
ncbi:MAG: PH domain-containing protein [Clostridia bacterium]|nr:PH domain-containing protein [Clostridia bacterium]